ncbi:hypothetical protein F511_15745 [Dorcoceras hygrometricum]|uniref:Uncharacterized protein n=1 Tax=Dorcoceras hygrometricum TaxID=472368 RepID=A0A2Z7B4Y5_9LAMI|nr:hypothetical protein F511_15745 [Dorcoceras hygrometricum]
MTAFCLRAKDSADGFTLRTSSRHGIQSQESRCSGELQSRSAKIQTQRKNSAEAQSSSRHGSAAKQLTIYESWMSIAELNSNGKNDKKSAKKRTQVLFPVGTLQNNFEREEFCVQRDLLYGGYICEGNAIEEDCGRYRQYGPRPETRLLRQPALEALTNSARTDSPRRVGRKQLSGERSGGDGGDDRRRRRRLMRGRGRRPTSTRICQPALGMEQSWSLEAAQEKERAEQAQLQIKRGADAEVALEHIKDEEQPA